MATRSTAEVLVPLLDQASQRLIEAIVAAGSESDQYDEALAPAHIALFSALAALGREYADLDRTADGARPVYYADSTEPPLPVGREHLRLALTRAGSLLNEAAGIAANAGDSTNDKALKGEIAQALSTIMAAGDRASSR